MLENFWGKSNQKNSEWQYLSVWEHSLNVTTVALVWLEQRPALMKRWVRLLEMEWNEENKETAKNIALHFILLHDLGKYDVCFQSKCSAMAKLLNSDFSTMEEFQEDSRSSFDHGGWGFYYYSMEFAGQKNGFSEIKHRKVPWYFYHRATACHHGSHISTSSDDMGKYKIHDFSKKEWVQKAVSEHIALTNKLFPIPAKAPKLKAAASIFLSGLCSVSDWLGSNDSPGFFELKSIKTKDHPEAITTELKDKAEKLLRSLHLLGKYCGDPKQRKSRIFNLPEEQVKLRGIQKVAETMELSKEPQLIILEAPMGEGKTEAAMIIADRLLAMGAAEKLYFGLPTLATSNAMYDRLSEMLSDEKFFDHYASLTLATGKRDLEQKFQDNLVDLLIGDTKESYEEHEGYRDHENLSATKTCNAFFAQSHKRSLLANAGVGTVDQAMSSVLNGRHHWVKLFGLSNSILIIDEIHAYDAYMTKIIQRLLLWMKAMGTHIILLSATLTEKSKQEYISAFSKQKSECFTGYPLITHVPGEASTTALQLECEYNRELEKVVAFKPVKEEARILKTLLQATSKQKAQTCYIVNTVRKAQDLYDSVREEFEEKGVEVLLFHSRFIQGDRGEIEDQVKTLFGKKNENRYDKGRLLIATQVVEQSLDVDFDIMASELAPIDLLLQRVGRLHRHGNNLPDSEKQSNRDNYRKQFPWGKQPCFFIDLTEKNTEEWLDYKSVYDPYILYRTAMLFESGGFGVNLPGDIREKIRNVYQDEPTNIPEPIQKKYRNKQSDWTKNEDKNKHIAANCIQPEPEDSPKFLGRNPVEKSDSEVAELEELESGGTRLASPSVQIVFADPQWRNKLDGLEEDNQNYRDLKRKLQENSLSVPESMLMKGGAQTPPESSDLDISKLNDCGSWPNILKSFQKDFPKYQNPKPIILPFTENMKQGAEEHFHFHLRNYTVTLKYSPETGLMIDSI